MFSRYRTRRQLLTSAGVLGVLGAATGVPQVLTAHAAASATAIGAWELTNRIEDANPPTTYYTSLILNLGGTMISTNSRARLNNNSDQYGVWSEAADGTVSYHARGYRFDAKGNAIGRRDAHLSCKIDAGGMALTGGVGTIFSTDLTGKVLSSSKITFTGARFTIK
jgi:hypothetical protein